ncbi:Prefoldin subunit 6 [Nibea albiflora]|uniref:Prefoldin subunit 6 n=1 Tax=Nibea albiflora TaxID=240163 RepID=A0ACB7EQZ7_NIBAL|nr:Prefoldin subunit 6 [Nibea albiflora]
MSARQKLETQLTENNIVKEEMDLLDSTNTVYKLIGPVLVKQDLDEAKATVTKRLEYINGEM